RCRIALPGRLGHYRRAARRSCPRLDELALAGIRSRPVAIARPGQFSFGDPGAIRPPSSSMQVSFPSLRDLTPSDRRILAPAFGAAAVAARRQGKRALDCLYSSLTEALLRAPYPDAVA